LPLPSAEAASFLNINRSQPVVDLDRLVLADNGTGVQILIVLLYPTNVAMSPVSSGHLTLPLRAALVAVGRWWSTMLELAQR
jgi:hypothetical protein